MRDSHTESTVKIIRQVVNRRALVRACGRAVELGVARGGIYDVRSTALVIWGEPWSAVPLRPRGEPIGMISWQWNEPSRPFVTLTRVEAAPGHTVDEILEHLRRLIEPVLEQAPGDEYV